jgi:hypothetical protein
VLDGPRVHSVPTEFVHDPHHYVHDYVNKTDEEIIKLNGNTRLACCFPKQDLNSSVVTEPSNYHLPFAGQDQTRDQTDLHLRLSTHSARVSFTLDQGPLTHVDFVGKFTPSAQRPRKDGTSYLTLSKASLLELLSKDLESIDIEHSPYHMNIFDIVVTEETSKLLVDFDKIFASRSHVLHDTLNL